jgi:riboflavin biosynthesis pyrimidine reductase
MRMLLPSPSDDVDPVAAYVDDPRPGTPERPWVVVNVVASADGSATDAAGASGELGGPGDRLVFSALRSVADVILAGATTVDVEDYGPSRPTAAVRRRRMARGQAPAPRIAVATASLRLDPGRRLFTDPGARPIVLTTDDADPDRRRRLEQVAEVHSAGAHGVDWPRAIRLLGSITPAAVVLGEGGPHTTAQLLAADLVDEMCITVAPTMLGGPGPRIAQGTTPVPRSFDLARVLTEDDHLFLRYVRARCEG